MKKLILVANDAPSSGVSLLSNLFGGLLRQRAITPYAIIHTGSDEPQEDETLHLDFGYGFDFAELSGILEDNAVTVIDVASGYANEIASFITHANFLDLLDDLEVNLGVVSPVGAREATFASLMGLGETLNNHADYLVVHNQALSSADSSEWEGSHAQRAMSFLDTIEMQLPHLDPETIRSGSLQCLEEWEKTIALDPLANWLHAEQESSPYAPDTRPMRPARRRAA